MIGSDCSYWGSLMSLDHPKLEAIDGSNHRLAIVAANYNKKLVDALLVNAHDTLRARGAHEPEIIRVPGSAELPYAASLLAASENYEAIITIGVLIAGETNHHNFIGNSTADALQRLSLQYNLPVINGILITENRAQAEARAGDTINRGKEFAEAALAMAQLRKKWTTNKNQ